jgi:hypothetical protein
MFLESLNRKKSMETISPSTQPSTVLPDTASKRSDQNSDIQQETKSQQTNDSHCAGEKDEKERYNDKIVDESRTRGPNKRKKVIP